MEKVLLVFRMLFSERDALLRLYNALNGTVYTDPNMPLRNLFYLADLYKHMALKVDSVEEFTQKIKE